MQTLADNFEQQQQLVSFQLGPTAAADNQEGVIERTIASTITSKDESVSHDIRPITPEVTYPYPLYKTEEYYSRRLAMKPNQVRKYISFIPSKMSPILCKADSYSNIKGILRIYQTGWNCISSWCQDCFFGNGRKRTSVSGTDIEYIIKRLLI